MTITRTTPRQRADETKIRLFFYILNPVEQKASATFQDGYDSAGKFIVTNEEAEIIEFGGTSNFAYQQFMNAISNTRDPDLAVEQLAVDLGVFDGIVSS